MKKVIAIVALGAASTGIVGGCGVNYGNHCEGGPCPPPAPTCEEDCVTYMDATWDMALVGRKPKDGTPFRCPDSASEEAMYGEEIDPDRSPPLRVLACSVLPEPTCTTTQQVCVPYEPDFAPCILQLGPQSCPTSYAARTLALNDTGHTFTICCEPTDPP